MKSASTRNNTRISAGLLAALWLVAALPQMVQAAGPYYWDNNSTTAGFGTAGGTWGTDALWSTDAAGVASTSVTNPATSDALNFGYLSTGLATGTVTVTGTQYAGSLTFAYGSGAITLSGGTAINLAAASTITLNNAADTISTPLTGAATSLTKLGTGTLTLNGANTYTGTAIIKNGSLQIGDGTTGSLVGTNPLTFSGTGTFNVKEADTVNQGMGTLSFNAGQGTVKNTFNTTASTLTFSGMNARSAGATANFTISGGTNGTTNKIVLSSATNAPMSNSGSNNPGIFFGLDSLSTAVSYARYDATGSGYFRATAYPGDTNATTTAGTYGSAVDLSLGDVTTATGGSVSLNTLRAVTATTGRRFDVGNGNTLSINGILAVIPSQAVQFRIGTGTADQGFLQPTSDGGEVVFAVARGNASALTTSSLAVGNIIQDFSGGSAGTKVTTESNATMVFQASNTYTGVTTINSGLLRVLKWADAGSASGLGKGSTGTTPNAADIVINGGILNYGNVTAVVPARTNRLFTIGPAGATLDCSGNSGSANSLAIGQNSDGSSSGNIAFSDSNAPASLTLANNAPAATLLGVATLSAVLGDPGTGTNVTSLTKTNAGTWILTAANTHHGLTRIITGGTLQLGNNLALQNSIFDPSGGGTLAFSSGINTPTLGGLTSSTNLTLASNVTALALNPDTGVTANYSGILGSATPGMTLEKKGAGTQVLSGVNTYTGATAVNGGKLVVGVAGVGSITSNVTVASSAALGGSGTITGNITLNAESGSGLKDGGKLAPGNSPGVLTATGTTTLNTGSIFSWTIDTDTASPGRGTEYSGLNTTSVSGTTAAVFQIVTGDSEGFADNFWTANHDWTDIFKNVADTSSLTNNWATVFSSFAYSNGTSVLSTPTNGSFSWTTTTVTGDTLTWTAVPEPTTALAGILLGAGLLRRRRGVR